MTWAQSGHERRMQRVLAGSGGGGPTVMVALDDSLIAGPNTLTSGTPTQLAAVAIAAGADSILGFPGLLSTVGDSARVGLVVNLTASTTRNDHVTKVWASELESASLLDADAVAVHMNLSASTETRMIQTVGRICGAAQRLAMPVLCIAYPRRARPDGTDDNYADLLKDDPEAYATLVMHAARVAVDLGCSIVKTRFPGSLESTNRLVEACDGVPVLIAGGPLTSTETFVDFASNAAAAGATGVSVGRNFFQNPDPADLVRRLRSCQASGKHNPSGESR